MHPSGISSPSTQHYSYTNPPAIFLPSSPTSVNAPFPPFPYSSLELTGAGWSRLLTAVVEELMWWVLEVILARPSFRPISRPPTIHRGSMPPTLQMQPVTPPRHRVAVVVESAQLVTAIIPKRKRQNNGKMYSASPCGQRTRIVPRQRQWFSTTMYMNAVARPTSDHVVGPLRPSNSTSKGNLKCHYSYDVAAEPHKPS